MRAFAHVEALRRIETVAVHEDDAEAGQWLATPASRRTSGVWTDLDVYVETETFALACEHCPDVVLRSLPLFDLWLPRDAEQSVVGIAILAEPRSQSHEVVWIVAGNDDGPVDKIRIMLPRERHDVDAR